MWLGGLNKNRKIPILKYRQIINYIIWYFERKKRCQHNDTSTYSIFTTKTKCWNETLYLIKNENYKITSISY